MLHITVFFFIYWPININDKCETVTEVLIFGFEYREFSPANHEKLKLVPKPTIDLFTV